MDPSIFDRRSFFRSRTLLGGVPIATVFAAYSTFAPPDAACSDHPKGSIPRDFMD